MLMKIIAYNFLERLSIPAKRRHGHFLSLVISIKNIIIKWYDFSKLFIFKLNEYNPPRNSIDLHF